MDANSLYPATYTVLENFYSGLPKSTPRILSKKEFEHELKILSTFDRRLLNPIFKDELSSWSEKNKPKYFWAKIIMYAHPHFDLPSFGRKVQQSKR